MTVRVLCHEEPDGWWAESPDVEGWSAAGETFAEVRALAEEGIRFATDDESVDGAGRVNAMTIANAKWLLEHEGKVTITVPKVIETGAEQLAPALAG